jgi:hypothetical protein
VRFLGGGLHNLKKVTLGIKQHCMVLWLRFFIQIVLLYRSVVQLCPTVHPVVLCLT